jgi:nondiscriminating glutamyl-tRNA synthetase
MVRVRYAPSPTGEIHIGNARTALFNYLFAKHHNGTFVLRLDDTDEKRSTKEAIDSMVRDITWLGLDWDEGYLKGGDYGPYRQRERISIYNHYIDILLQTNFAYELYYTDEEVDKIREDYEKTLRTFSYRKLKENETEARVREFKEKNINPAIVFKVEEDKDIVVNDLVRGNVKFNSSEFKDFVIRRSNGLPVYNYATVIDDALMQITHVIRAEEHLSNTPKQILIFQALNFPLPLFAHISLILAPDRTKLSKRHGATSLGQFREMGILPEALFNFLALLGWSPKDNREFFTKDELINLFDLDNVNKAPAVFDFEKLKWMNHKYIVDRDAKDLCADALPYLKDAYGVTECNEKIVSIVDAIKGNMNVIPDVVPYSKPFFEELEIPAGSDEEKILKDRDVLKTFTYVLSHIDSVQFNKEAVEAFLDSLRENVGVGSKKIYHPLRVALYYSKNGPELYKIFLVLGKDEVKARLTKAINLVEQLTQE